MLKIDTGRKEGGKNQKLFLLISPFFLPLLLFLGVIASCFSEFVMYRLRQSNALVDDVSSRIAGFFIILVFLAGLIGLLIVVMQAIRRKYNYITKLALVAVVNALLIYGMQYPSRYMIRLFEKSISENGYPLVAALGAYQRDFGEYPDSLEDLIPKYISTIPNANTSLVKFKYFRGDPGVLPFSYKKHSNGGYELWANIVDGSMVYWPSQEYPIGYKSQTFNGWLFIPSSPFY